MLNDVGHVKTCAMEQFKLKVKTRWSWKVVILYFVSIACCYRFSSNSKSNNWQAVVEIGALKKENKSKKNKYEKEEQEEENKSEEDDEGEEYHNKPKITVKESERDWRVYSRILQCKSLPLQPSFRDESKILIQSNQELQWQLKKEVSN
ncbi:hypothetical protein ACTFIR_003948 [Dictyostelium discoideum]